MYECEGITVDVVAEIWRLGPLEKGFLASASKLPRLVVRIVSGEDGSPKSCCLCAAAFGHRCSQFSAVCGSTPQLGHSGLTVVPS